MHKDILFIVLAYKHKFITLGQFAAIGVKWRKDPSTNIFRNLLDMLNPQQFDKLRVILLDTIDEYGDNPESVIKSVGGMGIVQRNFAKWEDLYRINAENWGVETIIEDDDCGEIIDSIIKEADEVGKKPVFPQALKNRGAKHNHSEDSIDGFPNQQMSGELTQGEHDLDLTNDFEESTLNLLPKTVVNQEEFDMEATIDIKLKKEHIDSIKELEELKELDETKDFKLNNDNGVSDGELDETKDFILQKPINHPTPSHKDNKTPYLSQSSSRGEIIVKDYKLERVDRKSLIDLKDRNNKVGQFHQEPVHKPSDFSNLLDEIDHQIKIPINNGDLLPISSPKPISPPLPPPPPSGDLYSVPPPPPAKPAEVAGASISSHWSKSGLQRMGITSESEGRYKIKGEKYRGAIGKILIGLDSYIGREVAIKELLPSAVSSSNSSGVDGDQNLPAVDSANVRFLREARLAGQLQHPSIIPIYEIGKRKDGTIYYTMRHVKGKNFSDTIMEAKTVHGRLKLIPHFLDLCNAISYAHSQGVVHRDIKPDNIMIGEFGETVVLDWGLAKMSSGEDLGGQKIAEEIRKLTQGGAHTIAGQAMGTPVYMPPEQAKGEIFNIDHQSDIYSLGAVLYELLVGSPLWSGNIYDILHKVVHEQPALILKEQPAAPNKLAKIAHKALSKIKNQRYESVSEMVSEIESYMAGDKISGFGSSSLDFIKNVAGSKKKSVYLGLGTILLLGILLTFSIMSWRGEVAKQKDMTREVEKAQGDKYLSHFHISQAFNEIASRMEQGGRYSGSQIYAAASLLHNPANEKSEFYNKKFIKTHPDSRSVVIEAVSKIYKAKLSLSLELKSIYRFNSSLVKLAVSPNDKVVALGCYDNSIRIVDIKTKNPTKILKGHTDRIYGLDFSPDGKSLVSGGYDKTVKVWDVESASLRHSLKGHNERIIDLSYSPDGSTIASLDYSGIIILWDLVNGKARLIINKKKRYKMFRIKFSQDGKLLIAGGREYNVIIFNSASGRVKKRMKGFLRRVNSIAVSPDNRKVVACGDSNTIAIWDISSGNLVKSLQGHTAAVQDVTISPDGKLLYSGSLDKSIRIWDMESGRNIFSIDGHKERVYGIAYLHDNVHIVTASWDYTVKIWKIKRSKILPRLHGHTDSIVQAQYSPNGKFIASSSWDRTVKIWNGEFGTKLVNFRGYGDKVWSVSWSPDGRKLASSCWDGTITILNTQTGSNWKVLKGHKDRVYGLGWSKDGQYLISSSKDNSVIIWDVNWGKPLHVLKAHTDTVRNVAVSKKGSLIASVSKDKDVIIWSMEGKMIRRLKGHTSLVSGVDFSSDGKLLVTSSKAGEIFLWNVKDGKKIKEFIGHKAWVNSVKFSSDSKYIGSASDDHTARIWSVKTGRLLLVLKTARESYTIDFSPDGKTLLYGDGNEVKMVPMEISKSNEEPEKILKSVQESSGLKLKGFILNVMENPKLIKNSK
jgi:eukaryotic-like serine/threonine-protein kinase